MDQKTSRLKFGSDLKDIGGYFIVFTESSVFDWREKWKPSWHSAGKI